MSVVEIDIDRSGDTPSQPSRLALDALRIVALLQSSLDRLARPYSLSASRWQILDAVRTRPMSIAHIARAIGTSRQNVRVHVGHLHELQYVHLQMNLRSSRARLVRVTSAGLEQLRLFDSLVQSVGLEPCGAEEAAPGLAISALARLQSRLMASALPAVEPGQKRNTGPSGA